MVEQISSLKTDVRYKDTPIGKVPVDWEVVRLENISLKFYNGGTPDTTNKDYWNGKIPWVTGADFENQKVGRIRRYISNRGVENSATNIVQKGNILVVTRTGVGKLAIAPVDIAISQDITGVVLDQEKALPTYIYWYLNHSENRLKSIVQGTSINGLLRDDLESFAVSLPPLSEQKKIAQIISTLDDAIEKTIQVIEKAKEIKKGLMPRLFTQGIDHKKFKRTVIGEIPEKWNIARLKDISKKFYNGGTPDTTNEKYWDGNIPWITGADFENQKINMIRKYITNEGVENSSTHVVPKGSLLVVTRTGVGKLAIAPFDIAISQDITGIIFDIHKTLPSYIYWYLDYKTNRLKSLIQGRSINGILRGDLESFIIPIPSVNEQKIITDMLFSIEEKIEKESSHLDQLKLLKKGLMQVLLTGKLRVTV